MLITYIDTPSLYTLWGLPPMEAPVSPLPPSHYKGVIEPVDVVHKFSRNFLSFRCKEVFIYKLGYYEKDKNYRERY
jgi:hypothetical protein